MVLHDPINGLGQQCFFTNNEDLVHVCSVKGKKQALDSWSA